MGRWVWLCTRSGGEWGSPYLRKMRQQEGTERTHLCTEYTRHNRPMLDALATIMHVIKVWRHRALACDGSHSYCPGSRASPSRVTSSSRPRCSSRQGRRGLWSWPRIRHWAFFLMIPRHHCWTTDQMIVIIWTFSLTVYESPCRFMSAAAAVSPGLGSKQ